MRGWGRSRRFPFCPWPLLVATAPMLLLLGLLIVAVVNRQAPSCAVTR